MFKLRYILLLPLLAFIIQCASSLSYVNFFNTIVNDLQLGNYQTALKKIDLGRKENKYTVKERVLYYLDKGAVHYYVGNYQQSIENLEKADRAMEELFTKSVSQMASSWLVNDNVIDYYGEIYENVYVNVFKAMDYLDLNKSEDALVEVRRVNTKLQELEEKYGKMINSFNKSGKSKVKVKDTDVKFYSDALAHYLSYLIFRMDGEEDESRISRQKIKEAFATQPKVYYFSLPGPIRKRMPDINETTLNVLAFTGPAPVKEPVGMLITSYDGYLGISDLSKSIALPNYPFPGMKAGYHFKFSFPVIRRQGSKIAYIKVFVDGNYKGSLELLEDMGKVAQHTFEQRKNFIYIKTLIRTVTKGLAAAKAKDELRKRSGNNLLGNILINAAVDAGVDATEKPDLRCWRTMPQNCYIGEFFIPKGKHTVEVQFLTRDNLLIQSKRVDNYEMKNNVNILDFVSLN